MTAEDIKALGLLNRVRLFAQEHRIRCSEAVYQRDDVAQALPELVEELLDLADAYVGEGE